MLRSARRAVLCLPLILAAALPAQAEFLSPDWADLSVKEISGPDWIAGARDGGFIGMCTGCDGTMMLEVRTVPDDGTGGRVHSGETTAETYTEIGQANAERLGGDTAYYGTEAIDFASAKGFVTSARIATGNYSISYQLWDDGQQLLIRVYGADQAKTEEIAAAVFEAAAPMTFR